MPARARASVVEGSGGGSVDLPCESVLDGSAHRLESQGSAGGRHLAQLIPGQRKLTASHNVDQVGAKHAMFDIGSPIDGSSQPHSRGSPLHGFGGTVNDKLSGSTYIFPLQCHGDHLGTDARGISHGHPHQRSEAPVKVRAHFGFLTSPARKLSEYPPGLSPPGCCPKACVRRKPPR